MEKYYNESNLRAGIFHLTGSCPSSREANIGTSGGKQVTDEHGWAACFPYGIPYTAQALNKAGTAHRDPRPPTPISN